MLEEQNVFGRNREKMFGPETIHCPSLPAHHLSIVTHIMCEKLSLVLGPVEGVQIGIRLGHLERFQLVNQNPQGFAEALPTFLRQL